MKDLSKNINEHYHKFIESGNIDIIQILPEYYPSRAKLQRRFGDDEVRIKWRSKQVVDFSFPKDNIQEVLELYLSGRG